MDSKQQLLASAQIVPPAQQHHHHGSVSNVIAGRHVIQPSMAHGLTAPLGCRRFQQCYHQGSVNNVEVWRMIVQSGTAHSLIAALTCCRSQQLFSAQMGLSSPAALPSMQCQQPLCDPAYPGWALWQPCRLPAQTRAMLEASPSSSQALGSCRTVA